MWLCFTWFSVCASFFLLLYILESHSFSESMRYFVFTTAREKRMSYRAWLRNGITFTYISVQFSCSVVSDSLWPHGLQHTRLPCPSPTPGACSNSCPSSWCCHPTISSSVVPFSSCLSKHQGLFQWVSSSHQMARVLEFQLQHQSFQWTPRTDL